jgi:hypothetical protein
MAMPWHGHTFKEWQMPCKLMGRGQSLIFYFYQASSFLPADIQAIPPEYPAPSASPLFLCFKKVM